MIDHHFLHSLHKFSILKGRLRYQLAPLLDRCHGDKSTPSQAHSLPDSLLLYSLILCTKATDGGLHFVRIQSAREMYRWLWEKVKRDP